MTIEDREQPGGASSQTGLAFRSFYLDNPIVDGRAWDLFMPAAREPRAAVFFVHGGGWRSGSRSHYHTIIEALLQHDIACASTDYRLQNVRIADQLADVRAAYAQFLLALRSQGCGLSPVVVGSSAGAHLALLLALAQPGACAEQTTADPVLHELASVRPAGAAVVSAPLTFELWDDVFPAIWDDISRIVGVPYEQDPGKYSLASPIRHVSAESPAVLLMEAANEHMFPRQQSEDFMAAMQRRGRHCERVVYENAEHGFFYGVTRACQRLALKDLLRFVRDCTPAETHAVEA